MIVLDTNVVSELVRPAIDPRVRRWLAANSGTPMAVTSISVFELQFGVERLPVGRKRSDLQARLDAFLTPKAGLSLRRLDSASARRGAALMAQRVRQGRPVGEADMMMIAGIAAEYGAALATRNVRDFEGLGLALIDPWAA